MLAVNSSGSLENYSKSRLEQFAKDSIALIKENLAKPGFRGKPTNASGKTAASLEYEIGEDTLIIYGAAHIFALEFGRGPSKNAGGEGGTLRERIRHWIDDKGIVPDGISKDSLAFLIARKIHKQGTLLYQSRQQSGILTDVINQQRLDELATQLLDVFAPYAVSKLIGDLQDA